jgi:predicted permease
MIELFGHIVNVVLPIALCVLVGYALAVLKLPFDRKMIGSLVQNVGYPALILSHLTSGSVSLSSFMEMVGAALAALTTFVVVAAVFLRVIGLPLRAFIAPMSLNNVGNIGLPVAALAIGDAGLSYSLAFVVVVLLGIFTYGTWVPRGEISLRGVLTSPVIYAIAIALLLLGLHLHLPKPLASAFEILGDLAIPLMLLTLGHTLATLTIASVGRGAMLAGFHLLMSLATAFGLAALFGFSGIERDALVLMCMMPVSVATYLFVELYTPEYARDVASLILVSTLLTVFVLPAVMTIEL